MDSYLQAFTKSIKERTITILQKKKKKAEKNSEFMTCRNTKNKHQNPDLQTQGNFLGIVIQKQYIDTT
jgi:hypothetical protein